MSVTTITHRSNIAYTVSSCPTTTTTPPTPKTSVLHITLRHERQLKRRSDFDEIYYFKQFFPLYFYISFRDPYHKKRGVDP